MFKSKKTQEAHRRGAINGGKTKCCKGFAYMKIHDPERLKKISKEAVKKREEKRKNETTK